MQRRRARYARFERKRERERERGVSRAELDLTIMLMTMLMPMTTILLSMLSWRAVFVRNLPDLRAARPRSRHPSDCAVGSDLGYAGQRVAAGGLSGGRSAGRVGVPR